MRARIDPVFGAFEYRSVYLQTFTGRREGAAHVTDCDTGR